MNFIGSFEHSKALYRLPIILAAFANEYHLDIQKRKIEGQKKMLCEWEEINRVQRMSNDEIISKYGV